MLTLNGGETHETDLIADEILNRLNDLATGKGGNFEWKPNVNRPCPICHNTGVHCDSCRTFPNHQHTPFESR